MKTFTSSSGRSYVSVKSARPDPASRFEVRVSDGYYASAEDLAALGQWLIEVAQEYIPQPDKKKAKAAKTADVIATEGDADA